TEDRLGIRNDGTGAGQVGTNGSNVTFGGTQIGTFSGGTDGSTPLVISFNSSSATPAAAQALAEAITYTDSAAPASVTAGTRTVSFVVNDGDGGTSSAATKDVSVTAPNQAPVVTTTSGTTAYTGGNPPTTVDTGVTVTDADSPDFNGGSMTVSFSAGGQTE